jgi:glyoxylase-like metal-dependent hydrolase (beta-lactamase superfamily II)
MKLFDNLYYYIWQGKGNNCNTYVFTNVLGGDRPHVLIDPGHVMNETKETCLDTLLKGMGKDGIKPEDIGLIINTHGHWDHFQASRAFLSRCTRRKWNTWPRYSNTCPRRPKRKFSSSLHFI